MLRLNSSRAEVLMALHDRWQEGFPVEQHPLGFFRVPLTSTDRLHPGYYCHVWTEASCTHRGESEAIHCHVFDLASRILVGSLSNYLYAVQQDGDPQWQVYEVHYQEGHSTRVPTQEYVACEAPRITTYGANTFYQMDQDVFHQTVIDSMPVATLMQKTQINTARPPRNLIAIHDVPTLQRFDHRPCSTAVAWEQVFAVVERMRD